MKMKCMDHAAHGGGAHMAHAAQGAAKKVAQGGIVSATLHSGKKIMSTLTKHPIVLIGLGFTVGYMVHKHRKGIIRSANSAVDKSKDFVLNQKENLEDIVAEKKEQKD